MGLWQRMARAFGRDDATAIDDAEQILLEADFGMEATHDMIEGLRRAPKDARDQYLEWAVRDLLD